MTKYIREIILDPTKPYQVVTVPKPSVIKGIKPHILDLSFQGGAVLNNGLRMWLEVEETEQADMMSEEVAVRLSRTGEVVPEKYRYINTVYVHSEPRHIYVNNYDPTEELF